MTFDEIEKIFTYHAPNAQQQEHYQDIREAAKQLGHEINNSCPDCREKSLAITHLQTAVMFANASIAIPK